MRYGAQIEIVPRSGAADAIIRPLREATEMLADAARDEEADLVESGVVVRRVVRRRWRLVGVGMHVGGHRHGGDGRGERVARAHGVTFHLEFAAEGRELGPKADDMTSGARLLRLLGKRWHSFGTLHARAEQDDCRERYVVDAKPHDNPPESCMPSNL